MKTPRINIVRDTVKIKVILKYCLLKSCFLNLSSAITGRDKLDFLSKSQMMMFFIEINENTNGDEAKH